MILAAGDGRLYLGTELSTEIVFLGALVILIPHIGLTAAGVAFYLQYIYYFPLVWWIVRRRYALVLRPRTWTYLGLLSLAALAVSISAWTISEAAAAGTGLLFAAVAGVAAFRRIYNRTGVLSKWLK
jgi:O-antigen/teichoic acid export membrane protein